MHERLTEVATLTSKARSRGPQLARGAQMSNALMARAAVQRSAVKYGPLVHGCGSSMSAEIYGPADPDILLGSNVGNTRPPWWPTLANGADAATIAFFSQRVVQGHLLNQELGGSGGDMKNLTPITRSTNSTHYAAMEKLIKDRVKNHDEAVQYKVTPDYNKTIPPADFGPNLPVTAVPLLANMAGEIEVEFTSWRSNGHGGYVKSIDVPGQRIKNEGTHLSGTFT